MNFCLDYFGNDLCKRYPSYTHTNDPDSFSIPTPRRKGVREEEPAPRRKDVREVEPTPRRKGVREVIPTRLSQRKQRARTPDRVLNVAEAAMKGLNTINNLATNRPIYLDKISPRLQKTAYAIDDPVNTFLKNGWEARYITEPNSLGMNVLYQPQTKKALINFRGVSEEDPQHVKDNVFRDIIRGRDAKVRNSRNFRETDSMLEHIVPSLEKQGYSIQFNGHSYGGYKARYFGAKYNQPVELLNAHIFPWNKFPNTTKPINFHTIVNDPTNFKHIFGDLPRNERHWIYPEAGSPNSGTLLSGHYISAFTGRERNFTNLQKYLKNVGYIKTALGGLAVGGGIADIAQKKDPTQTIAQGLTGNLTETGMLGYNIDPDYQWNDDNPPNFGMDWALYHTTKGITDLIGRPEQKFPKAQLASNNNMANQTSGTWEGK